MQLRTRFFIPYCANECMSIYRHGLRRFSVPLLPGPRFEDERLSELASPIAKAWRRDGVKSRIAASSFFRWLAASMWPGEVTDKQLLEFAMDREP